MLAALRAKSRDNARTPMQWDGSPNAGFTTGTPWLAVNPNYVEINAAAQVDDPDSVFSHYRAPDRAAAPRDQPSPTATSRCCCPTTRTVYAFTRRLDDIELLVLANFSDNESTAAEAIDDATAWAASELVNANYAPPPRPDLTLRPWETRVYRRSTAVA